MQKNDNLNNDGFEDFNNDGFDGFVPYNPSNDLDKAMDAKIHLHIKKRNARKYITTVEGLAQRGIDIKKFVTDLKPKLCCAGTICKNDNNIEIVQLQGDHREALSEFLQDKYNVVKYDIIKHGF